MRLKCAEYKDLLEMVVGKTHMKFVGLVMICRSETQSLGLACCVL